MDERENGSWCRLKCEIGSKLERSGYSSSLLDHISRIHDNIGKSNGLIAFGKKILQALTAPNITRIFTRTKRFQAGMHENVSFAAYYNMYLYNAIRQWKVVTPCNSNHLDWVCTERMVTIRWRQWRKGTHSLEVRTKVARYWLFS